jgi:hypothetical protein
MKNWNMTPFSPVNVNTASCLLHASFLLGSVSAVKQFGNINPSDRLRTGRPRGRSSCPGGGKNFHFFMSPRPPPGATQPPIQWLPGARSPAVKRPEREANHSPPSSAEVKKMLIYTSTPTYVTMA